MIYDFYKYPLCSAFLAGQIHWMGCRKRMFLIFSFIPFQDIEIPTVNNVRNAELMGIILYNENNVLCVGPTGTGKTLTVIGKLSKNMHKKFICDFMSFSARTTANQTQVSIVD